MSMNGILLNFRVAALWLVLGMMCACSSNSHYEELLSYAESIEVINTHEHQRWNEDMTVLNGQLSNLIQAAYLGGDMMSAGGHWFYPTQLDSMSMEEYWDINGEALDHCRTTSYYAHFIAGFRELYDFINK